MDKRHFERPAAPLRAFRDLFAVPYVGVSYDLAPHCVGVHPDHLERVPDLAGREVLVTRDGGRRVPMHRRQPFRVVPIRRIMRNATEVGGEGGVVFSTFDVDDPATSPLLADMRPGDVVYLNAALARLPDVVLRRPFTDDASSAT